MKNIFILLLLFTCAKVFAQSALLPVECGTIKQLSEAMVEFKEVPFATGETTRQIRGTLKDMVVLFFLNDKTGTWTIAEKASDDLYCITSSGRNFIIIEKTRI